MQALWTIFIFTSYFSFMPPFLFSVHKIDFLKWKSGLKRLLMALRLNPQCSPGLRALRSMSLHRPSWIPGAGCHHCPSFFRPASSTLLYLAVVPSRGLEGNPCPGLHQQVHAMTRMEVSLPRALSSKPARRSGPSGPVTSSCFIFSVAFHITR